MEKCAATLPVCSFDLVNSVAQHLNGLIGRLQALEVVQMEDDSVSSTFLRLTTVPLRRIKIMTCTQIKEVLASFGKVVAALAGAEEARPSP